MGLLLADLVATRMSLVALLEELMAAPDVGSFCYAHRPPVKPFKEVASGRRVDGQRTWLSGRRADCCVSDGDGVKYILTDNSWLLIRPSGTGQCCVSTPRHAPINRSRRCSSGRHLAGAQIAEC